MKNEIVGTQTNKVAKTEGEKNLALQARLLEQLETGTQEMGQSFSPYGKQCVINAIAALMMVCKNQDISMDQMDGTMVRLALQNIGYTELNIAAIPSECYFDLRKGTAFVGNVKKTVYSVSIRPQGAGNEKLVRKYGVGLAPNGLGTPWLVREGDEFTYPTYDGFKMIPPKWIRKSGDDKKVLMVVYPVIKANGQSEFLIATREGIKPNIIAQIRQNALYSDEFKVPGKYEIDKKKRDAFYERVNTEFEKLTVDEILSNPEWIKWVNPTYTSGGSKEAMVIRKMKNNALKNFPKEFDSSYVSEAVKDMFEDKDDSLFEDAPATRKLTVDEKIEAAEKDTDDPVSEEELEGFTVDSESGEVYPTADTTTEPDTVVEEECCADPEPMKEPF